MKKYKITLKSLMLFIIFVTLFNINVYSENLKSQEKIMAFPDAEGGGMYTTGARGVQNPEVYHVTNLNDSGAGSFRDAVSKSGRFIVFDVGGNINLESTLYIRANNLTILGQTAPGEGISIDRECVYISGSNIILRYLRFRMASETKEADTVTVIGGENIIIDHCSMCWSVDECLSFYAVKNFTVQWSIISESLNNYIHTKGTHGMGGIWGGINSTAHHNLLATNNNRNPMIGTGATVSSYKNTPDTEGIINVRNNVMYNWGSSAGYGGQNGVRVNLIGNYYRPGPATKTSSAKRIYTLHGTERESLSLPENGGTTGGGKGVLGWATTLFVDKNYVEGADEVSADNWLGVAEGSNAGIWEGAWKKCESISDGIYVDGALKANDEYLNEYPIITQSAETAYNEILNYAGASIVRDSIDKRVINDVINKTAPTGSVSGHGLVDRPDDVGGFIVLNGGEKEKDSDNDGIPDFWEDINGLNKNDYTDGLKIGADGYTSLEKYAEELAVHDGKSKADKTELRETIYSALNEKEYNYTQASWNNFNNSLEKAKETVSKVYASQDDTDNACDALKLSISKLEPDEKGHLKFLIERARAVNSYEYTEESYLALSECLAVAEGIYEKEKPEQGEIKNAEEMLESLLNNLSISYKYLLSQLIAKAEGLNQMNYKLEHIEALISKIKNSRELLNDLNASNEEFKNDYDNLNLLLRQLSKDDDIASKMTGDFEGLACFNLASGNYGKFNLNLGKNTCEIKENLCGNETKALVLKDMNGNRTALTQNFPEKLKGLVSLEGDFYFEDEPNTESIFFRLGDNDFKGFYTDGRFLEAAVTRVGSKACLNIKHSKEAVQSFICDDVVFEKNKWYNIKLLFDTFTKKYSVEVNGKRVTDGMFTNTASGTNIEGISKYTLATPGGKSQILAVDNLKIEAVNDKSMLSNCTLSGAWKANEEITVKGDIVNYGSQTDELLFIAASYENERLIDADISEVSLKGGEIIENALKTVRLGEKPENCIVKVFLWKENMEPLFCEAYEK